MENDYPIPRNILKSFDLASLMKKMASADWYHDYSDDPAVRNKGLVEISAIRNDLLQISKMEGGVKAANYLWDAYVPVYSVARPAFLVTNNQTEDLTKKLTTMNDKNFEYLSKQLKFTGFGEDHATELKEKMQKGETDFALFHKQDFGKDSTVATLHFKKSEETDNYFFNRYSLAVNKAGSPDVTKQTYYINNKEDNVTLKEAYNQLDGRAVLKEVTPKEGEKFKAWKQLDFKETDESGNFKMKQFHPNYGFDLKAVLAKHPIKELGNETDKQRLIESLERGNRQSVTLQFPDNREAKTFIEAAPQFKSLNFYDSSMKRTNIQSLSEANKPEQSEKQSAKQSQAKAADDGEGGQGKEGQSKGKRKRKSQSL